LKLHDTVRENPLLAILRGIPPQDAIPYAQACIEGGVRFFEVALNSPHALEEIRLLADAFGSDALLGAGTVLTPTQAEAALEAGARFLLSPSCPAPVLDWCRRTRTPYLPGVLTPTDVGLCLEYGFDTLKLFPAGSFPPSYIHNLKGPFDGTEYVAIGGVKPENTAELLRQGYLGVGMGSNLFPADCVAEKRWKNAARSLRALTDSLHR